MEFGQTLGMLSFNALNFFFPRLPMAFNYSQLQRAEIVIKLSFCRRSNSTSHSFSKRKSSIEELHIKLLQLHHKIQNEERCSSRIFNKIKQMVQHLSKERENRILITRPYNAA
jgi:hypothetical protein